MIDDLEKRERSPFTDQTKEWTLITDLSKDVDDLEASPSPRCQHDL
jgi:hypothetical protein